jgi:phage terminase large subunit-like protein
MKKKQHHRIIAFREVPFDALRDDRVIELTATRRAARVIQWIENLEIPSGNRAGKKFRLDGWQKEIIRDIYKTKSNKRVVRLAVASFGRKNGKTTLAACLALCHLSGPESVTHGEVYSAAADRPQAAIVYQMMEDIALANEVLAARIAFKSFKKQAEDIVNHSRYAALSSDAKKAHGLSPTFFVADEVAQWRGRDLLDALRTGSGAHDEPLGLVISTRSPDTNSPLEELISYGLKVAAGEIVDPTYRLYLYSAPIDADPWSPDTWRLANPAMGKFRSLKDIEVLAGQAQHIPSMEASFRAYVLNQPVATDRRWLGPGDWEACAGDAAPAGECHGGLDLSAGPADLTAFSLYWPSTGTLKTWAFLPEALIDLKGKQDNAPYALWAQQGHVIRTPGKTIDRAWLGAWIAGQTNGLELKAIASDRWMIDDFKAQLEREGIELPLQPHGAGYKDVSPSLSAFEAQVLSAKLRHGGNPLLRWAVSNVLLDSDPAGNRKPAKNRSVGRIDPAVSAIYAVGIATRHRTDEIDFGDRALVISI